MIDRSVLLNYSTRRKCFTCHEYIVLEKELENVVYYKKNIHHIKCLREKLLSKKIGRMEEGETDKLIEGLRCESESHGFSVMVRNHLKMYLMEHYNLISLSTYEYQKLEEIFAGTFKSMSKGIPPEAILDMVQRRQDHYDSVLRRMRIDDKGKVNYLLGMVIKDYPSYVDFIEKSKVEKEQAEVFIQAPKIDLGFLSRSKGVDVVNILDDDGEGD